MTVLNLLVAMMIFGTHATSLPAALVGVSAMALLGWWQKLEPRKSTVTEESLKDLKSRVNALCIKLGMVHR